MSRIYLKPGQSFQLSMSTVEVGPSGTKADLTTVWNKTIKDLGEEDGVGTITPAGHGSLASRGQLTFNVYVEESTGRFWYDDERGY